MRDAVARQRLVVAARCAGSDRILDVPALGVPGEREARVGAEHMLAGLGELGRPLHVTSASVPPDGGTVKEAARLRPAVDAALMWLERDPLEALLTSSDVPVGRAAKALAAAGAFLRKAQETLPAPAGELDLGSLTVDRHDAHVRGVPCGLSRAEHRAVTCLAGHAGRVVTFAELERRVPDSAPDVTVKQVHKKLIAAGGTPAWLASVKRVGYRLAVVGKLPRSPRPIVDRPGFRAWWRGTPLILSPDTLGLFEYLLEGAPLDELPKLWHGDSSALAMEAWRLRRALGDESYVTRDYRLNLP